MVLRFVLACCCGIELYLVTFIKLQIFVLLSLNLLCGTFVNGENKDYDYHFVEYKTICTSVSIIEQSEQKPMQFGFNLKTLQNSTK